MRKEIAQWWNTPLEHRGMKTPKQLIREIGSQTFDVDAYVDRDFAELQKDVIETNFMFQDDNDPQLNVYWQERGITRVVHGDAQELTAWTIYYAESDVQSGRKLPLMVNVYNAGVPMLSLEALGFVRIAAEYGFMVLVPKDGNGDENVLRAIEQAKALYPVDPERIFLAGHSFGGGTSGRQAISHPDVYAGVCIMGTQYGGADNTSEELARAETLRLPMVTIGGTKEVQGILPFNCDPPNDRGAPPRVVPNMTPPHHTRANCLKSIRLWRQLNGCKVYTEEEDTADLPSLAEQKFGVRADRTDMREIGGKLHYVCESVGKEQLPILRCVAIEDCPHCVSPTAAALAWEFLKQFRRDQTTGELKYIQRPKSYTRIESDVSFHPGGPMMHGFRITLAEGADVSELVPMDFDIRAYTDMRPIYHQMKAIGLDRSKPGELYLMTPALSTDLYAPVYGGKAYRGGFHITCRDTTQNFDFSAEDVAQYHYPEIAEYKHIRFDDDGFMGFDYVQFVSHHEGKLPLIFYSMGSGWDNNEENNEQVRNHGAAKLASEAFQAVYPCHVIAPWFPMPGHPEKGESGQLKLEDFARSTAEVVKRFAKEYNVDTDRIYFVGVGGGALYQHLAHDKHLYAAAAMLTSVFDYFADGSELKYVDALGHLPIYITHGTSDFPCPVRRSRLAYRRLLAAGNRDVTYREYSDAELSAFGIDVDNQVGSHSSSLMDFATTDLYRWLFSKKKTQS